MYTIRIHFSVWKVTLPSSFTVWFTLSKNAEIEIWRKVHLKISLPMHYSSNLATTSYYVCTWWTDAQGLYFWMYEIDTIHFFIHCRTFILMTSFGCVIKTELKYDVTHLSQNVLTIVCLVLTECKSIILTFLLLTNVLSVEAKVVVILSYYLQSLY